MITAKKKKTKYPVVKHITDGNLAVQLEAYGPGRNHIKIVFDWGGTGFVHCEAFNAINIHDVIELLEKASKKWKKYTNAEF